MERFKIRRMDVARRGDFGIGFTSGRWPLLCRVAAYLNIPLSRGEKILLAEDDIAILKLVEIILKSLEYIVVPAASPRQAIKLAKQHAGEFSLLMTDVIMPEMKGRDLSKKLQETSPGLKILFMSGYTADVIAHRGGAG